MLRGGPLAEKRIIQLLNRRYVAFYFNVGKGQHGYDELAAELIASVDERFAGSSVPTPPVWIFTPDLELAATLDNYLPKDRFFDELVRILAEHPEQAAFTKEEQGLTGLAAAQLAEQLGDYSTATGAYEDLGDREASVGLLRIARHRGDWERVAELISRFGEPEAVWQDEIAVESAYLALADEDWEYARQLLTATIHAHPESRRLGEMHFLAGVTAFHLGERDWANFHWCWVLANLPDDNQYMRCYLAATVDAMPYPNPELKGYRPEVFQITHDSADRCRAQALADYERLKADFVASSAE